MSRIKLQPQKQPKQGCIVHITSTINNTKATLADAQGNTLLNSSSGLCRFKKSQRASTYAAQLIGEQLAKYITKKSIQQLGIKVKGVGKGKEHVLRGLSANIPFNTKILYIHDVTALPHNGCRPRKKRRI